MRLPIALCVLLLACVCVAEEKAAEKIVVDDPAKVADPDFKLQGEYSGQVQTNEGVVKFGAQIIALGNGKFRGVGYAGGLPGDGWIRDKRMQTEAEARDGALKFSGDDFDAVVQDGQITISDKNGNKLGELKKVHRESLTLGEKPPQGALVLFDGKSTDAFEGSKITGDGLLIPAATSKHKYQSVRLHLEFRTPYQPNHSGQERGNSGAYLQGRWECQVLDSFGLEGKDNECGGLYSVKDPDLNMCYPPLSWQTYDIDFTAARYDAAGKLQKQARITVRHNGVVIHDDVELPDRKSTAAPVEVGPEPGPLYLQDHGNPVRYRNIWLVERK